MRDRGHGLAHAQDRGLAARVHRAEPRGGRAGCVTRRLIASMLLRVKKFRIAPSAAASRSSTMTRT